MQRSKNVRRTPVCLARTGTRKHTYTSSISVFVNLHLLPVADIDFASIDATALVTADTSPKTKLEQLCRYVQSRPISQRTASGRQDCRYETILYALTTHYRASVLLCDDVLLLLIRICSLFSDTCSGQVCYGCPELKRCRLYLNNGS